jgi:hypothetical protein
VVRYTSQSKIISYTRGSQSVVRELHSGGPRDNWDYKRENYETKLIRVHKQASEAWVMNKADEGAINIFERKILRGIFGAIKEGDHWRRRYNNELYRLYGDQDLVSHVKVGRIRRAGYVARLEDSDPAKQVPRLTTVWSPESW